MCQVQRLGEVISRRRNSHEIQQLKRVEEIVRHSSESWRARDKELLHNEKKWTIAEGAIYADFDKDKHIVEKPPDNIVRYYAGVDWGWTIMPLYRVIYTWFSVNLQMQGVVIL